MMDSDGWGFFGHGFGLIFWFIIIAAIVVLITRLGSSLSETGGKSALEILKERYARGEIEREEFERKRKEIEN